MFDTDGNQEIDLEEFKVLEDIFSQSATNALRKVTLGFVSKVQLVIEIGESSI